MPNIFWVGPCRFPVFWDAGNELLSVKKAYRSRVGPYQFCEVLINSEILKAAHCTEVLSDALLRGLNI